MLHAKHGEYGIGDCHRSLEVVAIAAVLGPVVPVEAGLHDALLLVRGVDAPVHLGFAGHPFLTG